MALTAPVFFLSGILGKAIRDQLGERLGTIKDLSVRLAPDADPIVTGLVAQIDGREAFLSLAQIATLNDRGLRLTTATGELQAFTRRDHEVLLGHEVLDRQLIDLNGRRIIRVNDLALAAVAHEYRLVGVDGSHQALLRRLFPTPLARCILGRDLIPWQDPEYLASQAPGSNLQISHARPARLHPRSLPGCSSSWPTPRVLRC
jgi:sporulation protein YlmC with PRC-barrel domain